MASNASLSTGNLLGKSVAELRGLMESLGEPAYRGSQLYHALYAEKRFDLMAMTNLPAGLREKLAHEAEITLPKIVRRHVSSDGGVRYILALPAAEPRRDSNLARTL